MSSLANKRLGCLVYLMQERRINAGQHRDTHAGNEQSPLSVTR